jgi:hypothetical protein
VLKIKSRCVLLIDFFLHEHIQNVVESLVLKEHLGPLLLEIPVLIFVFSYNLGTLLEQSKSRLLWGFLLLCLRSLLSFISLCYSWERRGLRDFLLGVLFNLNDFSSFIFSLLHHSFYYLKSVEQLIHTLTVEELGPINPSRLSVKSSLEA